MVCLQEWFGVRRSPAIPADQNASPPAVPDTSERAALTT